MTRLRDLAGNDVEYAYTPDGDLALVTRRAADSDVAEPLMRIEYDATRTPAALMRLDGQGNAVVTTRLRNNTFGQPVSVTDGRATLDVTYTRQGYPATLRDAFGRVTRISYDEYNRRVETIDPTGAKTRTVYNASGLVAAIERNFGGRCVTSVSIDYNDNGQAVAYTDQRGRVKRLERDALGRVIKELFPDNTGVEYGFDPSGQMAEVLDQNGHALAFEWGSFGIESKETAAGQLTDYIYDADGRLARIDSRFSDTKTVDRSIALAYDGLDRVTSVNYGNGQIETMTYDSWGKVVEASSCGSKASLKYDYFGRLIEKREGKLVETYAYNAWGQRTERVTKTEAGTLTDSRIYDRYGRLSQVKTDKGLVQYAYNSKNQLVRQSVNGTPIEYAYTPEGWLASKVLGGSLNPVSTLKYFYELDGRIAERAIDGNIQKYRYDAKDQLTAVLDADNKPVELYAYDPAGNIQKKTVNGITTAYVYDAANQLVSSQEDGLLTTRYCYDAVGRLIEEGDKSYHYGWLDKVVSVSENGQVTARFGYHAGGQLATAKYSDKTESFLWDGLALIRRGETEYVNEPHAGGGAPVLAGDKVLFNDLLGSTLGAKGTDGFSAVERTAFGETDSQAMDEFFTGKPMVGDLGYTFLFRNYRPEQGKWQTADPLGYPDGWNQLAYCNSRVTDCVDWLGAVITQVRDINNNNALVYGASGFSIGHTPGDGRFEGDYSWLRDPIHGIIVTWSMGIYVDKTLPWSANVESGTTTEYKPHASPPNYKAEVINPFREMVIGHERGHASAFMDILAPLLTSYLSTLNFSQLTDNEIEVLILNQVNSLKVSTIGFDIGYANQGTYAAFDSTWKKLPDENGYKRWKKE